MTKAPIAAALACAALVVVVADRHLGELLPQLLAEARGAPAATPLPAGNPDATITSGVYAREDHGGRYVYRIQDIGQGRALIAYTGERGGRPTAGETVTATLIWAVATAGGAAWTAAHAENNWELDCRIQFIAHTQSLHLLAHDCPVAGTVAPPREAILRFIGPLQGDEFAAAQRSLGITVGAMPSTAGLSSPR